MAWTLLGFAESALRTCPLSAVTDRRRTPRSSQPAPLRLRQFEPRDWELRARSRRIGGHGDEASDSRYSTRLRTTGAAGRDRARLARATPTRYRRGDGHPHTQ